MGLEESIMATAEGSVIQLYVQPGARKTELSGFFGEPSRLKLRVAAPPVEGAANEAVLKFFSKLLGVRTELQSGGKSRKKSVLVRGLDVRSVRTKIENLMNEQT
jgi:uncharacterized protein (TIGR00251 family)